MALLSYEEISAITYQSADIGIRLTPAQQSFIIQAVALFNYAGYWSDYEDYSDTIDALVAASEYALQIPESYPPNMIQIDLFTVNATPLAGVGTLTYNVNGNYPFGYNITTQDVALYGMTQPVWLKAGEYDYAGWYSKTTLCGNTGVAITDAGGVVDTIVSSLNQNGLANVRHQATGTFTVPADGLYNMVVGNVSPVSGNEQCSWISHHIRQTS